MRLFTRYSVEGIKRTHAIVVCLLSNYSSRAFTNVSAKFVRSLEQVKTFDCSCVFTELLSISPKRSPRFSPGYEGTENMFYFLNNFHH